MANNFQYEVHKGLQKPLVFKGYKGRFIYWMAGGLLLSFLLCVVCCITISYPVGGGVIILGCLGTILLVNNKQKDGVHSKNKTKGVVYINPNIKQLFNEKK